MKHIKLIVVGKIKEPFWADAAEHYRKRLGHSIKIQECIVKDGNAKLSNADRNAEEGERILAALGPADIPICMDEHGKTYTSVKFARFMEDISMDGNRIPCFIIGGAFGLAPSVLAACRHKISLSPMTFTHEMARVLLMEQLYRADAILRGSPYHHE
jgi:23S rRNA (pseudouridine1915-N3)-methyltransferase